MKPEIFLLLCMQGRRPVARAEQEPKQGAQQRGQQQPEPEPQPGPAWPAAWPLTQHGATAARAQQGAAA